MKTIKTTDIAYFAGYIDGDGCFYIGKERKTKRLTPRYVMSIIVSSVNKEPLLDFQRTFGGAVSKPQVQNENWKPIYQYSTRKEESLQIAHQILPYLTERKEECELMVKFANTFEKATKEESIEKMTLLKKFIGRVKKEHVAQFSALKNRIEPVEEDYAYLAGFIDAECSFGIQRDKPKDRPNYTYKITLQCNNSKAPVFKWIMERFGGHIHFYEAKKSNESRRSQLHWRLTGNALSKIIAKIYPFLKHKQPVCKELMNFYETTLKNGGARHTEAFRTSYAETLKIRENIVSNVHKLNLKGLNT